MAVRWKDKAAIDALADDDRLPVTDTSEGEDKHVTPLQVSTYLAALFQPVDSDLTAIAALSTTSYGRSLLTLANATALAAEVDSFFLTPAEGNAAYQPLDSDLTAIAALTTTAFGRSLLALADDAAARTALDLATTTTDHAVSRYDGTGGATQNSGVTIDDTNFIGGAAGVGVGGAAADATNRISANTPAVLFNRETDDIQVKLNKQAAGDTASFLFQTNFSGRAEIGLTGDDDFHFKVSPDGSAFHEGLIIDKDDGSVSAPNDFSTVNLTQTGYHVVGHTAQITTQVTAGDSTPAFQVIGTDSNEAFAFVARYSADQNPPRVGFAKSRNATEGSHTVVQSGDYIGEIVFAGSDGANFAHGATIRAEVSGTPGTNDMPTDLVFLVSADSAETPTEMFRVLSSGGASIQSVPIYTNIPQNSQSSAYTTVLADAQKHLLHPTADNNARTFTIAANASVAYPIGTAITFVNQINTVTIAINSDTLVLAGAGTTGSRSLAANGVATALKIASTTWIISGTGLT